MGNMWELYYDYYLITSIVFILNSVSSKRFTFIHIYNTGCYLVNTRVTTAQFWCRSVISIFYSPITFFFIGISQFFSARFLSSLDLNPPSEHPIFLLIKNFQILTVEETGVLGAPVSDPHWKSLLYSATYLVPQAGVEPTPRTDIGYRPKQVKRVRSARKPRTPLLTRC
jgi:hypothetical protein